MHTVVGTSADAKTSFGSHSLQILGWNKETRARPALSTASKYFSKRLISTLVIRLSIYFGFFFCFVLVEKVDAEKSPYLGLVFIRLWCTN